MTTTLPADYHMHSHHSGDSNSPMKDMIESAISRGLKEICFTEHMDMDFPLLPAVPKDTFTLVVPPYREELFSYKEMYKNQITIRYGVELGLQTQVVTENQAFVKENDFDFVIASMHLIDKMDPYYKECWEGKTEKQVISRYFELTIENLSLFNDYDVLGHLDYIVRYTPSKGKDYSYGNYKELIDEILSIIIKNGKGLDVNTKALFQNGSMLNPNKEILKRYREMGGEIITFGSDAHIPEGVAGAFEEARQTILELGFEYYYTFESRKAIRHDL